MLSVATVPNLELVVKLKLGTKPLGNPVILGRLVTNKGIKDLVFIDDPDTVFAVDPDLGRRFWTRSGVSGRLVLAPGDEGEDAMSDKRTLFLRPGKALNAANGQDIVASDPQPAGCQIEPATSVLANGVLFELRNKTFLALDAATKRELFKYEVPASVSGMALANGHVCFGDAKGTLYCFGFPVDF